MPRIYEFNDAGKEAFRDYLVRIKSSPSAQAAPPPIHLLNTDQYIQALPHEMTIEQRTFPTKAEFAKYIFGVFKDKGLDRLIRNSTGLWAWLTLFYFDEVCPLDGNNRRRTLSIEKYVPSAGHIATGLDKHLLFFPWKMYALHGENVLWLFGSALREDTKVVRELANSYRRNVSKDFMILARALYFDENKNKIKRGATSTNTKGNLRRLDRVMSQLDLTYDVFGIGPERLAELLPRGEFGKWLTVE